MDINNENKDIIDDAMVKAFNSGYSMGQKAMIDYLIKSLTEMKNNIIEKENIEYYNIKQTEF